MLKDQTDKIQAIPGQKTASPGRLNVQHADKHGTNIKVQASRHVQHPNISIIGKIKDKLETVQQITVDKLSIEYTAPQEEHKKDVKRLPTNMDHIQYLN